MSKLTKRTSVLILCLVLLAVGSWLLFSHSTGLAFANADRYSAGDADLFSPVENLDINWTAGTVNIEYHSGTGILLRETSPKTLAEDDRFRWWLDGTTLRIQYAKPGFRLFSFSSPEKTLTVTLPEGTVLRSATVRATSANVKAASLAADDLTLEITSGSVTAATAAKRLSVSSTSGDLILRQDAVLESARFTSTSGDIDATLQNAGTISADSTSGSISLSITGAAENVSLHSTSGSIQSEAGRADSLECSSTSGSITVRPGILDRLKIGSTSGSVTAYLPEDPGFTCRVSTTSGDISSSLPLQKNGDTYTCGNGSAVYSIETTSGNVRLEKAD